MFGLNRNTAPTPDNGQQDDGQGTNVETLDSFKDRVRLAVADVAARYFGAEQPAAELLASLGLDTPSASATVSVTVTFPYDRPGEVISREIAAGALVDTVDRELLSLPLSTSEIVREWVAEHITDVTVTASTGEVINA